ncbi:hypothetical protein [Streptomyces sp. NPDC003077]|uniref:hypothetical protein n=1 Tax=Streptomyces sp. NPDC003077 TaxID=3154443 RepID=UPI0033BF7811
MVRPSGEETPGIETVGIETVGIETGGIAAVGIAAVGVEAGGGRTVRDGPGGDETGGGRAVRDRERDGDGDGMGLTRRLLVHEGRWLGSLGLWVVRRRVGVREGDRVLPYASAQASIMLGLAFVCVVETVGMAFLLAPVPVAHAVMLVLDVYTVLMVLGIHAAAVTRPHVLTADGLRVRQGARLDLWIPLERIESVRQDLRFPKMERGATAPGVLEVAVASQTSVTVELSEPVVAGWLLGGSREQAVTTVRFHADDARGAVTAVREAVERTRRLQRGSAPSRTHEGPRTAAGTP